MGSRPAQEYLPTGGPDLLQMESVDFPMARFTINE